MYKCCIFDLDGTLINSIKAIAYSCNLTLKKYNLGPIDEDTYKILVGDGYEKLIERALIHCGDNNLENYEDALVTYMEYFKIHCMHEVKAYDGIHDMLYFLKKNNIKIAVLSNKPATLYIFVVSNISSLLNCGKIDVILFDSIVFPHPGGP